jgi:hypothetical protein
MKILKSLLGSKKFTVAITATLVWAVSLLGFNVESQTIGAILSPLYAYVLGQGIADAGGRKLETGAPL